MNNITYICEWVIQPIGQFNATALHDLAREMDCSIIVEDMRLNSEGLYVLVMKIIAPSEPVFEQLRGRSIGNILLVNCHRIEDRQNLPAYLVSAGFHVPHLTGTSLFEALSHFGEINRRRQAEK